MESSLFRSDDLQPIRTLISSLSSRVTIVDFEEMILIPSVRETVRVWKHAGQIAGFAAIDDFCNLWFETIPAHAFLEELETEIIDWGIICIKRRLSENSLDSSCSAENQHRVAVLQKHGFVLQSIRTLQYSRSLSTPIFDHALPGGFGIRCVNGRDEVDRLVALHRAAFGTENMTKEQRLAMMSVGEYQRELDLVVVAPNEELAALCVCGFNDLDKKVGYTDPVGTHQKYQRRGLGKAIVAAGLRLLKNSGANVVELSTGSDNLAMQKLALGSGFMCVSEKLWFSKTVV